MKKTFWENVKEAIGKIAKAGTVAEVVAILREDFADKQQLGAGDAFFPGSGGDDQIRDALREAGWTIVWSEWEHYYVAQDPAGDRLTYIEGDVYVGDQSPSAGK